jgi:hypothetical protein
MLPAVDTDALHADQHAVPPAHDIAAPVMASATGLVDELGLRGGDGLL